MKQDWTRTAVETLRRNHSITGRNRNIEALNSMLGTRFEPMPLEPLAAPIAANGEQADCDLVERLSK